MDTERRQRRYKAMDALLLPTNDLPLQSCLRCVVEADQL